jgi:type I restriction enzyme M protein
MLAVDLRKKLDNLWDKFWAGGLPNPLIAIDHINLLLFLRRLEDVDAQQAARAEGRDAKHVSIFEGDAKECRWSWWSNLPADQMYAHVQQQVIPWMRGLAKESDEATKNLVRDANLLIPSPALLAESVATIERLKIGDRNVDVQGDLYEYLLRHLQMAGQLGQFRTPRHIIRAIVELVDPKLGETVIDPACGTAGFLIAAHQHVLAAGTSPEFIKHDELGAPQQLLGDRYNDRQWQVLREPPLLGYDVDAQMARIGTMNLILHGIGHPKIQYANSLGKDFSHAGRANRCS